MSPHVAINQAQTLALARANALTKEQIRVALDLINSEFSNDAREVSPEIFSAVILALVTNYARNSPE